MADYSDDESASSGGGNRYSYSFSPGKPHAAGSDAEDDVMVSYSNAVSSPMKTSTSGSSATSDESRLEEYSRAPFRREHDDAEETIEFDRPSYERSGTQRANQEYYDVLEIASNRLRQDESFVIGDDSSGDEGEFDPEKT